MQKRYKRVYLEITNLCNLNCTFCPIDQRQSQSMSLEDFKSALDQVHPLADQVCLHLMGEPLAHPHIKEILAYCSQLECKIQLTTNGLLLQKYRELFANETSVVQINISLQSYQDNFPGGNFSAYLDSLFKVIDPLQEVRPELYFNLRLWNIGETKSDCNQNDSVFEYIESHLGVSLNRNVEVGGIKSKKIRDHLYLHFDSRFEWPRMELPFQGKQGRCNGLIDHFGIHADGTVVPCCLDDQKIIKLGNCFDKNLFDILESKRATEIRQGFLSGKLVEDLCQRCDYIKRFKK